MMVVIALRRGCPRLAALIQLSVEPCAAGLLGGSMTMLVMQRCCHMND